MARHLLLVISLFLSLAANIHPDTISAEQKKYYIDDKLRAILKQVASQSLSFADRFDAEVWLADMSGRLQKFVASAQERLSLLKLIHFHASKAGLEPELVLAVIEVESHFDRFAISSSGARGLMQIMPFWLEEIGRPGDNLFEVDTNLRFGCTILKYYLDMEKGNLTRALARYNGSLGKFKYPNKVFKALRSHWYKM